MGAEFSTELWALLPGKSQVLSLVAGIVCLDKEGGVVREEVIPMLEAMKAPFAARMAMGAVPECRAVLGRVTYGSSGAWPAGDLEVPGSPRLLFIGELYQDDIPEGGGPEDYLKERYNRLGVERFAEGLNGSFVAVLADRRDASLCLITDHIASYSLYTCVQGNRLYFASEVKGLLAIPGLPAEPDDLSVLSLVGRGHFFRRKTLADKVKEMDYATICQVKQGKIRSWQYWRYRLAPDPDPGYRRAREELAPILRQAVRRRLRNGRCAVSLSGGLDSRGIFACMEDPRQAQAIIYTLRSREQRHPLGDWAIAEKLCQSRGIALSVFKVERESFMADLKESVFYSDGAAGYVYENVWQRIREETGADFLLTGDECMGYIRWPISQSLVLTAALIHSADRIPRLQNLMRPDRRAEFLEQIKAEQEAVMAGCAARDPYGRVDEIYFHQRVIHFRNPKRRLIIRNGLGVRNPWLDLDVLNFIRRMPVRYRMNKRLFGKTLEHMNPQLFRVPQAKEGESANYQDRLIRCEQEGRGVSQVIFADNPYFDRVFDIASVGRFIAGVCSAENVRPPREWFKVLDWLPLERRIQVTAVLRYLGNPPIKVNDVTLLLRVMAAAEALRQLHHRFKE